jgi:hypothetical protein
MQLLYHGALFHLLLKHNITIKSQIISMFLDIVFTCSAMLCTFCINRMKTSSQSSVARYYWPLVFISGFSIAILLCVPVVVPLIISLKSFSDQTVTSATSITSTISISFTSSTSTASSTSTTTSATTTSSTSLLWRLILF